MTMSVAISALLLFVTVPPTEQKLRRRTFAVTPRSPDTAAGQLKPYDGNGVILDRLTPYDGDGVIPDRLPNLLGEGRTGHSEEWNLFGHEPALTKLTAPVGVVCRTLLHPQLRERYVKVFLASMLDGATAEELDHDIEEECRKLFEPDVWPQLFSDYTGSWPHDPPVDTDSAVFAPLAVWMNAKRDASLGAPGSWDDVTRGGTAGRDTANRIQATRNTDSDRPAPSLTRIMDFGCGDGIDLSGAARHLNIDVADAIGLDVWDNRDAQNRDGFTFLHADLNNYESSLQDLRAGVAGTVSFAWSFVTFHHIVAPNQRVAALGFIRDSLVEDGIFLLAEWDNPFAHGPMVSAAMVTAAMDPEALDFTIYFDLQHILPVLLLGNPAPTDQQQWIQYVRPLETEYLSAVGWVDTIAANGLAHDAQRSTVPVHNEATGETSHEGIAWMVENWPQRNFQAVFSKH